MLRAVLQNLLLVLLQALRSLLLLLEMRSPVLRSPTPAHLFGLFYVFTRNGNTPFFILRIIYPDLPFFPTQINSQMDQRISSVACCTFLLASVSCRTYKKKKNNHVRAVTINTALTAVDHISAAVSVLLPFCVFVSSILTQNKSAACRTFTNKYLLCCCLLLIMLSVVHKVRTVVP